MPDTTVPPNGAVPAAFLPRRTSGPAPRHALQPPPPPAPSITTPVPRHRGVTPFPVGNPRTAGRELGEAVDATWFTAHGGSRIDIPISIVAALALFPIKGHPADVARIVSTCSDFELIQGFREVYAHTWTQRPDLGAVMAPLMAWLTEPDVMERIYPVRRVTDEALRHGVLEMTGDPDPAGRCDTDLMSWTITSLRSRSATQGLGEYHTPADVCDVMARLVMDEPPPEGRWFAEPAAGTGGMVRALASRLRDLGRDPANYGWALCELDPLAAAGAAVNALVWGLGPNTIVACGNSLGPTDPIEEAAARRTALFEERDHILGTAAVAEAHQRAITLADRLIHGQTV